MPKVIYDPIYKYIELPDIVMQIIDTPEFQRLRSIKQLGAASWVFPSATHTRFEHSLGTSHLCGVFLESVKLHNPELNISNRDIELIQVAGLLHDVGHLAYSHLFDNHIIPKLYEINSQPESDHLASNSTSYLEHEGRSVIMLNHLVKKYNFDISTAEVNIISEMINPSNEKKCMYLYQIVNNKINGFDCDKIDYILRDCLHVGLSYSYNYDRLLKQIRVIDGQLCFIDKEYYNIFEIYEIRYKLHRQIYTHPVTSQIETMLLDIFLELAKVYDFKTWIEDPEKYDKLTDNIVHLLLHSEDSRLNQAKQIYKELCCRNLYKHIGDLTQPPKSIDPNIAVIPIKINFSQGNKNPLENIQFYSAKNKNDSFRRSKDVSGLPRCFETKIWRLIEKPN
jgi:HD superfamily phosphohydrolase